MKISREDIEQAARRVAAYVRQTPVISLERGIWNCPGHLSLKLEQLQHSGSFKARGAFNRLLSQPVPQAGVIAASGGNHGAAVAYAAQQLGYHAEIFVPEISARVKVERLRSYGADVHIVGATYADAWLASEQRARETGALVVHAYNQPEVVAGQGTVGYELSRQLPDLDTLLVAVGGGGLIGGIASWFQNTVRVIGVETGGTASMYRALQSGAPVDVEIHGLAADALGARRVGELAFEIAQRYVERVVLVDDEAVARAQLSLWNDLRLVAEPSAAAGIAALQAGAYKPAPDEHVGVLICGGNAQLEAFLIK
ncbi:serine/threonine dehydratase [Dictyobacter sp. S3.2.2.5]|uniref:Serine/threonine dehydratase n=1 Tax=Dictyobacter halimunensis TaxID=3026934 RepID=A0ABQ6FKL9_9CHLR|nr:serine/threonine dehydratase [Dictyobacter sp. S3.2.2.5]GLV54860.1 serine/threonine dehydratase [Dictyobacter sp. S3.2.2.5]